VVQGISPEFKSQYHQKKKKVLKEFLHVGGKGDQAKIQIFRKKLSIPKMVNI
jgi:hypothetical protein